MTMNKLLDQNEGRSMVAHEYIPNWWRQAVTIEYLPCRDFRKGDRIGQIDFSLVSPEQVDTAVDTHQIVAYGTVFHNVDVDTFRSRSALNLVSPIVKPLVDGDAAAIIPHGLVSKYHFPFLGNPVEVVDPIESFNSHVQVLDEGALYQWEVARFEGVEGRHYGRWVSEYVDLSEFDATYDQFQDLMRLKRILPVDEYETKANAYISTLRDMRSRAFAELLNVHHELKKTAGRSKSKVVEYSPPALSYFETVRVNQGEISTKASMAPVFYRAALRHSYKSEDLSKSPGNPPVHILDEIFGERAEAVIMAATCLEAVVNEVGYQKHDDIWGGVEKLSVGDKCRILFKLAGRSSDYDTSRYPFQVIRELITARNEMIHFKPEYKRVIVEGGVAVGRLSRVLNEDLVDSLPRVLRDLIEKIYLALDLGAPGWLDDKPGWKVSREV